MADKRKDDIAAAAALLGRAGGLKTSDAKTRAVRENGKLGGRPKKNKKAARKK